MLYLFNTAYRALYLRNVLNTLFLPAGSTNDYRFGPQNIDETLLASLKAGDPAQILFADRFHAAGYQFHPLRRATFVERRRRDGYSFFTVQLGDFLYPVDRDGYNTELRVHLADRGLPHLTNAGPLDRHDGTYALVGDDLLTAAASHSSGDEAWTKCVDAVMNCPSFGPEEPGQQYASVPEEEQQQPDTGRGRRFVFLRVDLRDNSGAPKVAELRGNRGVVELERGSRIDFELAYRYSGQAQSPFAKTELAWRSGERVMAIGNPVVNVESTHNTVTQSFTTLRHSDKSLDGIWIDFPKGLDGPEIIGPDACIRIKVVQGRSWWPRVSAAFVLFALGGALATGEVGRVVSVVAIDPALSTLLQKTAGLVTQALGVVWMAQLLGKKLL